MPDIPGPILFFGNPPLKFRFAVVFFALGVIPNPIDTMFQKVTGLGATIGTTTIEEGGQNLYTQKLPTRISHENLVLERGLMSPSPLGIEFNVTFSQFKFKPCNVLVSLLDATGIPVSSWLFIKAYPVKWTTSDLDADSNTVVIETMELAYQTMQVIRV